MLKWLVPKMITSGLSGSSHRISWTRGLLRLWVVFIFIWAIIVLSVFKVNDLENFIYFLLVPPILLLLLGLIIRWIILGFFDKNDDVSRHDQTAPAAKVLTLAEIKETVEYIIEKKCINRNNQSFCLEMIEILIYPNWVNILNLHWPKWFTTLKAQHKDVNELLNHKHWSARQQFIYNIKDFYRQHYEKDGKDLKQECYSKSTILGPNGKPFKTLDTAATLQTAVKPRDLQCLSMYSSFNVRVNINNVTDHFVAYLNGTRMNEFEIGSYSDITFTGELLPHPYAIQFKNKRNSFAHYNRYSINFFDSLSPSAGLLDMTQSLAEERGIFDPYITDETCSFPILKIINFFRNIAGEVGTNKGIKNIPECVAGELKKNNFHYYFLYGADRDSLVCPLKEFHPGKELDTFDECPLSDRLANEYADLNVYLNNVYCHGFKNKFFDIRLRMRFHEFITRNK